MSPKTAETLGLASEDVVRLDYAGRSLELPVWILPGMADGVVALTLGYGRSRAGRIGSGVGFDAFTVRAPRHLASTAASDSPSSAHVPALGDPGARQHGGAPRRARVDPDRASIEIRLRQGFHLRQATWTSRRTSRLPGRSQPRARMRGIPHKPRKGRSPRRTRRLRGGTASLLTLEGACLRSGPPVGDDDRPELVHRVQRVHGRLPEREQRAGRRQDPGREGARDALDPGRPVLLRRALRQPGDRLPARSLHALRGRSLRAGLPRGSHRPRRGRAST